MNKAQFEQYWAIRQALATEFFRNRCFVCRAKFGVKFQFHHLRYIKTEKRYRDFDNDPLAYAKHINAQIRKDPERFMLLCQTHHRAVEIGNRFKPANWKRMIKAVGMTKT